MMKIMRPEILLLFLLISCGGGKKEDTAEKGTEKQTVTLTEVQRKNAGITVSEPQLRDVRTTLHLNGKIDVPPQNLVTVSAPLGGFMVSTKLLPGAKIRRGEVLAVMEDRAYVELQQDYLSLKTELVFLAKDLERQKELNASKAGSDKQLQQAQTEFDMKKVKFSALAEQLRLIQIEPTALTEQNISRRISLHSPIDGYVTKVNMNTGKYVEPSVPMFELIDPGDIHLNLKVFEKDLAGLRLGQKVMAFSNNSEKRYPCEVILISPEIQADGSTQIHCHFEAYDSALMPGMYMNAELLTDAGKQWMVPTESVVRADGKEFIFCENGGMYEMLEVQVGISDNGYTSVRVADRDIAALRIVSKGAYSLLMIVKNRSED